MQSRTGDFIFGTNFNLDTDNLFLAKNTDKGASYPPSPGNFNLLDNTPFLLLDGTDFLLL